MATPAGQDLTIYYNAAQLTGTSGSVTRVLKRLPRFSPFTLKPDGTLVGATDVLAEQGDPPVEAMKLTLSMTHKVEGAASALVAERTLMDEMRAFALLVNPFDGPGTLRFDRSTAAGAAISTEVLKVRPVSVPRYGVDTVAGDGMVEPTRAFLETDWDFWCPLPYFYDRVATTAEVTANSPAGTVAVTNGGPAPCGVRFQVKNGGVTGAPTELTITNTTNSYRFIWRKLSGSFVVGDYVDWFYTDPREETHSASTSLGAAVSPLGDDFIELARGVNTITALRSGGTGTVVLTVSFKPRYLSV